MKSAATPSRVIRRGGSGPAQPEWDDIATYSGEWYRRFRDWHHSEFPNTDSVTRANLDHFVDEIERLSAENEQLRAWKAARIENHPTDTEFYGR